MSKKGNVNTATFVCWFTKVPCTSILFTSVGHLTVRLVSLTTIFFLFWKYSFLLKLTSYPAHSWCCRNFGALLFQCLCQSSLAMATVFQLLFTQFSGGTILILLLFSCSSHTFQGCPPQAADKLVLRHRAGSEAELTLVTSQFRPPTNLSFLGRTFFVFAKLGS